jgi:ferredoxin-type protein NapG
MSSPIPLLRFLRPPGARPEKEFLARCLHCGQCAQICPFNCIVLRTGFNLLWGGAGTPQIFPQRAPCVLCMQCSGACPSQALQKVDFEEVKLGQSRLDRQVCFTWNKTLLCRSCFERCPKKGRAIVLEGGVYPIITPECAGCGTCEHVCPSQAIVTIPNWFPAET